MSLRGFSIALFQATSESFSIACAMAPIHDVLPVRITLEGDYPFVSHTRPAVCRLLTPVLCGRAPVDDRTHAFDGESFGDVGPAPAGFHFALRNDHNKPLTGGAAKQVGVNDEANLVPVSVRRLHPGSTAYFPPTTTYRLGVARLAGVDPQAGLLMATSMIRGGTRELLPCAPTLGRFVDVRFGDDDEQTATYDLESAAFRVRPGPPA